VARNLQKPLVPAGRRQKTEHKSRMSSMSSPEISQVLAQMRVMRAQASAGVPQPQEAPQASFQDLLQRSIDSVNEVQKTANTMRTAFEQGKEGVDLADVMIAAQKSSLSFQAMVEVRNKLIEAYKAVKNMPV
jgi:flagellar hook-basal body complex protein FliE